jgi:lysophospholipase L1-like esterase
MPDLLSPDQTVLFIGDSVTDCGRSRENPDDLGYGYVVMIAAWYSALYPERRVRFLNRGISGNRVCDLRARWQIDCLDLRPAVVSILIGINDTWRAFDSGDATSTADFERDYRTILEQTRAQGARLVLCEPFVLPVPEDRRAWRADLDPRIHVVRRLAVEYQAVLVALDGIFAQAAAQREPAFWAADGVHPTAPGHALIAQSWLRAAGGL